MSLFDENTVKPIREGDIAKYAAKTGGKIATVFIILKCSLPLHNTKGQCWALRIAVVNQLQNFVGILHGKAPAV